MPAVFVFFYKIVYGFVAVPLPDHVQYSDRISRYCHSMTFRQVYTSRDYYKYSFYPLAIILWDALPESVVCLQSLDAFEAAICMLQHSRPQSHKACFLGRSTELSEIQVFVKYV